MRNTSHGKGCSLSRTAPLCARRVTGNLQTGVRGGCRQTGGALLRAELDPTFTRKIKSLHSLSLSRHLSPTGAGEEEIFKFHGEKIPGPPREGLKNSERL